MLWKLDAECPSHFFNFFSKKWQWKFIQILFPVAPHARYKVWIKPNGEMPFLYGGNIVKAHIGRWSEDCPEHQGVVVLVSPPFYSLPPKLSRYWPPSENGWHSSGKSLSPHATIPAETSWQCGQGFGVTARSTAETKRLEPTAITVFRQADVGEYLREVRNYLYRLALVFDWSLSRKILCLLRSNCCLLRIMCTLWKSAICVWWYPSRWGWRWVCGFRAFLLCLLDTEWHDPS